MIACKHFWVTQCYINVLALLYLNFSTTATEKFMLHYWYVSGH